MRALLRGVNLDFLLRRLHLLDHRLDQHVRRLIVAATRKKQRRHHNFVGVGFNRMLLDECLELLLRHAAPLLHSIEYASSIELQVFARFGGYFR